jgi:hypothetical protein
VYKTNVGKFTRITIDNPQYPLSTDYEKKYIGECANMQFLGVPTDSHLNWKKHCNQMILNDVEHV